MYLLFSLWRFCSSRLLCICWHRCFGNEKLRPQALNIHDINAYQSTNGLVFVRWSCELMVTPEGQQSYRSVSQTHPSTDLALSSGLRTVNGLGSRPTVFGMNSLKDKNLCIRMWIFILNSIFFLTALVSALTSRSWSWRCWTCRRTRWVHTAWRTRCRCRCSHRIGSRASPPPSSCSSHTELKHTNFKSFTIQHAEVQL